ncbi:MAG: hypothetical protein HY775_05515 [Acidobacteria bacterium]|nr:hypothetical protein [Acidobacteriota bacterium]
MSGIRERCARALYSDKFTRPVGFAREPLETRRRIAVRLLTLLLVLFIAWLLVTKVMRPPQETGPFPSALPARAAASAP